VQWSFSGIRQRTVAIRAIFNEELAQPPVSMKGRAIKIHIFPKRLERRSVGQQKPDATDVAVVSADLDERHSVGVGRVGGMTCGNIIEHQIGAPIRDSIKNIFAHVYLCSRGLDQLLLDNRRFVCRNTKNQSLWAASV
jgi:hypothetical protein